MKLKKVILLGFTTFVFTAFTGCGLLSTQDSASSKADLESNETDSSLDSSADKEDTEASAEEAEELLKQAETEKYNAYVAVNNFMFDRLTTVIDGYFRRVKFQKKFEMDGTDFWCNSLGDSYYEIIDEANEYVDKEPSFGKLDEAYKALYPAMQKMMGIFDEIYEYGDMKGYLDDDYAQAKKLHASVWKAYNEYTELSEDFLNELSILADKNQQETLNEYKEAGYMAHYTIIKTIQAAQKLQQEFYDQKIDDSNLIEADLDKIQPLYDRFVKLVKKSLSYIKDKDQLEKEGWGTHTFTMFEKDLKDTKVSLTKLLKRVKDQDALESYELNTAFPSSGTISEFEEKLGSLINSYNNLW